MFYLFLTMLFPLTTLLSSNRAYAQDPDKTEYDAALASVKNGSYYIVTEVDGIKYYVSRQGELKNMSELEDNAEDGLFEISQFSGGALYDVGWLIEGKTGGLFSNTTLIDGKANLHPGTGVFRLDYSFNRDNWERQVFFMNKEGKIAIRSCNTAYGTSSWADAGRAFWTYEVDEVGNPIYIDDFVGLMPCYSYEPAYVWMLEKSSIMIEVLIDGINYNIDNDRMVAEVTSLPNNAKYSGDFVVPSSTSNNSMTYTVTRIGALAFEKCSSLTSVTIPNSVSTIGSYAFEGCSNLVSVSMPNNIISFTGRLAFDENNNIESVYITNLATWLETSFPWGNNPLRSGAKLYLNNVEVKDLAIPEGTTSIQIAAFEGCESITSIVLPNSVTSIKGWAFSKCIGLTSVSIPNNVTDIGDHIFYGCSGLTSITLGSEVTSIGRYAFGECSKLSDVIIYASTPPTLGNNVFQGVPEGLVIHVPAGSVDLYKANSLWRSFGTIVAIEDEDTNIQFVDTKVKALCVANWDTDGDGELSKVEAAAVTDLGTVFKGNTQISSFDELQFFTGLASICDNAFNYCSNLTSVTIPGSVTSIGSDAFYSCGSLTSVTIPSSVTSIGDRAFIFCYKLKDLTISEGVKSIGHQAFDFSYALTSVIIPKSVEKFGGIAFGGCTSLQSIVVTDGNPVYDSRENCNAIIETSTNKLIAGCKETIIPKSIRALGYNAFWYCRTLLSITIPQNVIAIGDEAFAGCSGLTSIMVEERNTTYDSRNNCNAIIKTATNTLIAGCKNTVIPNSVTRIGNYAFSGRSGLTSVTIPGSVTSIDSDAFGDCPDLTIVTIPNSVTSIGSYAFVRCRGLTDVYCFTEKVPETKSNAFDYTPISSATLHVSEGSIDLYKATSPWSGFGSIVALTSPIDEVVDEADWTLLKLAYIEMNNGEGWKKKWFFDDESHSPFGLSGVEISNGHVTSINLSSNNLTGAFPYTLLLLPELKVLNISNNNLTGDIGLAMAAFKQKNPSKTFTIQKLDVSDNKFSGNIGLFANCFTHLTSLNASGNCLEDVYPMIPATVTSLDISRQTISRVVPLHLAKLSVADIGTKVPTILLYDHVNRTFSTNISMLCTTPDEQWGMSMVYQNGQLSVPYVSKQNIYYGESGDTLNVAVLKNDGTREGSTFRISLSFDEGDSNFDGQVNVLDLQANIMYIMEKYLTRPYNFTAANLWSDNLINVQDIIRLVDLLINMEPAESAFNIRKKVQGLETGTVASIFIQNGQIVLNSDKPVAAMDLYLSNAGSIEVANNLERLGMSVITKETTDGLHIIAYSMSGACIPSGISTIGTVDNDAASVRNVMLSDSEANAISVSIDNTATGVENPQIVETDSQEYIYDLQGRRVNAMSHRGVYIKNRRKIAK